MIKGQKSVKKHRFLPYVILVATRLMHQFVNLFSDNYSKEKGNMQVDKKLRRKMQEKKRLQGHAEDEHTQLFEY